jgi:exopolysaccharide production protein ExoY
MDIFATTRSAFAVTSPKAKRSSAKKPVGMSYKRALDIFIALSGIVILAPLLTLCFMLTIVASPGPALFRHRRVGFDGMPFECLKFRTMAIDAAERLRHVLETDPEAAAEWAATRKLRNDPRVTTIGMILPQLFNVLKGEMSIVGPRPVTEEELELYANSVDAYLACRPGITGLWQVSGRSSTTYEKRVAYDTFYAQNWSVALDVRIIVVTIPALLLVDNAC